MPDETHHKRVHRLTGNDRAWKRRDEGADLIANGGLDHRHGQQFSPDVFSADFRARPDRTRLGGVPVRRYAEQQKG
jgi:hypothetical protein